MGQRIAALLHHRDNEHATATATKDGSSADPSQFDFSKIDITHAEKARRIHQQRPKKKRKIVIHSSPYLRCVQTSIAVAAGISQYQHPTTPHIKVPSPSKDRKALLESSSAARASKSKSPLVQPLFDPSLEIYHKPRNGPDRVLLRIDAFLGEWLSPDYYEDITPPPNSTMMVAGAKADLLRRGDHIQEMASANSSKGHFPGGWVRKDIGSASQGLNTTNGASSARSSLAQVSAFRERSSSHGSALTLQRTRSREAIAALVPPPQTTTKSPRVYEAPAPSYSVSPADPIPRGYVAHAQDLCIQVDYQWDSMRPPQDWGDGGEYGDEWSTMHKRFRRGLSGMMQWYRQHGVEQPKDQFPGFMFKVLSNKPPPPRTSRKAVEAFPSLSEDAEDDDDEELVVVLITHGAGCNALLGAISNQPVLIDVGLASLSMAVRRKEARKPSVSSMHERRPSVPDAGMSETFEMKYLASTDHLRPGVDPAKPPQAQPRTQSPAIVTNPSLESRRRFTGSPATNSPIESSLSAVEPAKTWSSPFVNVQRAASSGSNSRYSSAAASTASGLWSSARSSITEAGSEASSTSGADVVPAVTQQQSKSKHTQTLANIPAVDGAAEVNDDLTKTVSKEERESGDAFTPLVATVARPQSRSSSTKSAGLWGAKVQPKAAQGLWGPPRIDDVYEHGPGPKRRWTMTGREDSL